MYEAFAITVHVYVATEGLYCLLLLASSLAYVECLDNDIHEVTTRLLETCGEGGHYLVVDMTGVSTLVNNHCGVTHQSLK